MRERQGRYRDRQRPSSFLHRCRRYCISAIDGKRKFHLTRHIHSDGWHTWSYELDFSLSWFSYRVVITAASATAFFIGLIQLLLKMNG